MRHDPSEQLGQTQNALGDQVEKHLRAGRRMAKDHQSASIPLLGTAHVSRCCVEQVIADGSLAPASICTRYDIGWAKLRTIGFKPPII